MLELLYSASDMSAREQWSTRTDKHRLDSRTQFLLTDAKKSPCDPIFADSAIDLLLDLVTSFAKTA